MPATAPCHSGHATQLECVETRRKSGHCRPRRGCGRQRCPRATWWRHRWRLVCGARMEERRKGPYIRGEASDEIFVVMWVPWNVAVLGSATHAPATTTRPREGLMGNKAKKGR